MVGGVVSGSCMLDATCRALRGHQRQGRERPLEQGVGRSARAGDGVGDIANYPARWQPAALMLWGRHDIFFELDEALSWMKALPRMVSHILDGPHLLLETHSAECAALMSAFLRRVERQWLCSLQRRLIPLICSPARQGRIPRRGRWLSRAQSVWEHEPRSPRPSASAIKAASPFRRRLRPRLRFIQLLVSVRLRVDHSSHRN